MIHAFLHIPKTSGTTIREYLKPHFSNDESILWYGNENFRENYMGISKKLNENIRLVFGHYHFGLHEHTHFDIHYHTILRNPVHRLISYYFFTQSRSVTQLDTPDLIKAAQELNIIDFFKQFPEVCNQQCRYLSPRNPESVNQALSNLKTVNFGLQDYTAIFIKDLAQILSISTTRYKNKKVSTLKQSITAAEIKQLTSLCAIDIEFFEKAKNLYLERKNLPQSVLCANNYMLEKKANITQHVSEFF